VVFILIFEGEFSLKVKLDCFIIYSAPFKGKLDYFFTIVLIYLGFLQILTFFFFYFKFLQLLVFEIN